MNTLEEKVAALYAVSKKYTYKHTEGQTIFAILAGSESMFEDDDYDCGCSEAKFCGSDCCFGFYGIHRMLMDSDGAFYLSQSNGGVKVNDEDGEYPTYEEVMVVVKWSKEDWIVSWNDADQDEMTKKYLS